MELKKKNWQQITINDYMELQDIIIREEAVDVEVGIVALLCGVDEDEIGDLTIDINDIRNKWNLIDYGDVVVHILHQEDREAYAIEKFWNHAFSIPSVTWLKESEEYFRPCICCE